MKITNYRTLRSTESCGAHGKLGINILIGGDLPNLENTEKLDQVTYDAVENIREELIALRTHQDPAEMARAKTQRRDILACFADQPIFVKELPNGYCSRGCCRHLPWFQVTTVAGPITIGWRKRVISIDWKHAITSASADMLFPDEDTTKGGPYIHAWSYEKAAEYLKTVIASAS